MDESAVRRGQLRIEQLVQTVKRTQNTCNFYRTNNPHEWLHLRQVAIQVHATLQLNEDILGPEDQPPQDEQQRTVLGIDEDEEDDYGFEIIQPDFGGSMFVVGELEDIIEFHCRLLALKEELFFLVSHPNPECVQDFIIQLLGLLDGIKTTLSRRRNQQVT